MGRAASSCQSAVIVVVVDDMLLITRRYHVRNMNPLPFLATEKKNACTSSSHRVRTVVYVCHSVHICQRNIMIQTLASTRMASSKRGEGAHCIFYTG